MMALINYRLKITLNDGRQLTGQMLAFDNHMNLVLAESEWHHMWQRSAIQSLTVPHAIALCVHSRRVQASEARK